MKRGVHAEANATQALMHVDHSGGWHGDAAAAKLRPAAGPMSDAFSVGLHAACHRPLGYVGTSCYTGEPRTCILRCRVHECVVGFGARRASRQVHARFQSECNKVPRCCRTSYISQFMLMCAAHCSNKHK
eukprot:scaffold3161_cov118-Isochrysis_galbana.AAC.10